MNNKVLLSGNLKHCQDIARLAHWLELDGIPLFDQLNQFYIGRISGLEEAADDFGNVRITIERLAADEQQTKHPIV